MVQTHILKQIDTWKADDFLVALRFHYQDNSESEIFGDKVLASAQKPQSWARKQDEHVTEFSVAKISGNLTYQIYAIELRTTKTIFSSGKVQKGCPLTSIWKSTSFEAGSDVGDIAVDQYPTKDNAWLVDIHVTTHYPDHPDWHNVQGTLVSEPEGVAAKGFKVTFELDGTKHVYNATLKDVIAEPFRGSGIVVRYKSTKDLVGTHTFSGHVGIGNFEVDIDVGGIYKVIVHGPIIGGPASPAGVDTNGSGVWSTIPAEF